MAESACYLRQVSPPWAERTGLGTWGGDGGRGGGVTDAGGDPARQALGSPSRAAPPGSPIRRCGMQMSSPAPALLSPLLRATRWPALMQTSPALHNSLPTLHPLTRSDHRGRCSGRRLAGHAGRGRSRSLGAAPGAEAGRPSHGHLPQSSRPTCPAAGPRPPVPRSMGDTGSIEGSPRVCPEHGQRGQAMAEAWAQGRTGSGTDQPSAGVFSS